MTLDDALDSKGRAAFHEAGHIVAYMRADRPVIGAWIAEQLPGRWAGKTYPVPWPVTAEEFDAFAAVLFAGPIAERAFARKRHIKRPNYWDLVWGYGGAGDDDKGQRCAEVLAVRGWRARAIRSATALVLADWPEITGWAHRLCGEEAVTVDTHEVLLAAGCSSAVVARPAVLMRKARDLACVHSVSELASWAAAIGLDLA